MLIPSMDISRLMVHAEEIEEQKLKQVDRKLKRTRVEDGNFSKTFFEVQDKERFKKMFPNQSPSTITRVKKDKGSTTKPKEKKGTGHYVEKSTCAKCVRKHEYNCLIFMV